MWFRRNWLRLLLGGMSLVACTVCVWPYFCLFMHDPPSLESMEVARRHAQSQGLQVQLWGGFQDNLTEPDDLGGCDVEVRLWLPDEGGKHRDYVARVRRRSFLTNWWVVEASARDVAE
jgi:hypothetical protein